MKQNLHLLWSLLLGAAVTPVMAQTADSPQVLQIGENTLSDGNIYLQFSYVGPAGLATLDGITLSSYSDRIVATAPDGSQATVSQASMYSPNKTSFYVQDGYTYDFTYTSRGETMTLEVAPIDGPVSGPSCDAPMLMPDEGTFMVPNYSDSYYSPGTTYFSYTPEISGKLKLYASDAFQTLSVAESCDGNWDSIEYTYTYGEELGVYVYSVIVDAGQTLIFKATGSAGVYLNHTLNEIVLGATCEDAMPITPGTIDLPAGSGTYYYQFSAPGAYGDYSALVISSDTEASAVLATSCTAYTKWPYSSLNFRRTPMAGGSSYILEVTKESAEAGSFTFAWDDLLPIEDENVGEAVEFGQTYTTPVGENTFYYSIRLPEGSEPKLLTLASDAPAGNYTSTFFLCEQGKTYPRLATGANFKVEIQPDITYILSAYVPADSQYEFSLSVEDMQAGQTPSYAIKAAIGDNEVPAFSPVYYVFSQDHDGFIQISSDLADATFEVTTLNSWGGTDNVALTQTADGQKFECVANSSYTICVSSASEAGTLTLTEVPYGPGESFATAIEVSAGDFTLPAGPSKSWYKVEAPMTGFFNLTTTMSMNYASSINVYVNDLQHSSYANADYSSYTWQPFKTGVAEGDTVYICFNNSVAEDAPSATVSFTEAEPGQTAANPIRIHLGDLIMPTVSGDAVWYGITLPAGIFNLSAPGYYMIELYRADDTATRIASCEYISSDVYGIKNAYIEEEAEYLLKLSSNYTEGLIALLSVTDPLPGQTPATAYVVEVPEGGCNVAASDISSNTWYRFDAHPGTFTIAATVNASLTANLYAASDLKNPLSYVQFNRDADSFQYGFFDYEVTENQTFYLCVTRSAADLELTFSGSAVEPAADAEYVAVNVAVSDGQTFSYNAPNHATTSFFVVLPDNWSVDSCQVNGEDYDAAAAFEFVTDNADIDVLLTLAYDGDVAFVDATTGVVELDARVNIYIQDGKIFIDNTTVGDQISVYNLGGMKVADHVAQNTRVEISLEHGTYIVTVNNTAAKVVL
ncbi:MAG: hypothetical protein K2O78_00410 [Muribaculaceae bacterium]|nr:hypothetical protein [Muribaculaceae bacterium]MDE7080105.1 hypothetical protein [Muribaculaceae bacterium]